VPQDCAESLWLSGLRYFNHLERLRLTTQGAAFPEIKALIGKAEAPPHIKRQSR
jgi:hypothetical protein